MALAPVTAFRSSEAQAARAAALVDQLLEGIADLKSRIVPLVYRQNLQAGPSRPARCLVGPWMPLGVRWLCAQGNDRTTGAGFVAAQAIVWSCTISA